MSAIMLPPGAGRRIVGHGIDATVKATMGEGAFAATFEVVVPPRYDVGAHVHGEGAEIFFVISGQLDVLAFEPLDRSVHDWHDWTSANGRTYLRGGPGSFIFVPAGTPHAFANPGDEPAVMFFQSAAAAAHQRYFDELAALLEASDGRPEQDAVAALRTRYDMEQLTGLRTGAAADSAQAPSDG